MELRAKWRIIQFCIALGNCCTEHGSNMTHENFTNRRAASVRTLRRLASVQQVGVSSAYVALRIDVTFFTDFASNLSSCLVISRSILRNSSLQNSCKWKRIQSIYAIGWISKETTGKEESIRRTVTRRMTNAFIDLFNSDVKPRERMSVGTKDQEKKKTLYDHVYVVTATLKFQNSCIISHFYDASRKSNSVTRIDITLTVVNVESKHIATGDSCTNRISCNSLYSVLQSA